RSRARGRAARRVRARGALRTSHASNFQYFHALYVVMNLRSLSLLGVLLTLPVHARAQQGAAPTVGDEARRPKLTKPPKLLQFVEAPYPESEKEAGKQASGVVQIAISA